MPKLTDSFVRRAGVTSRRWTHETSEINVFAQTSPRKLTIKFKIGSSGGTTDAEVLIGPKDFDKLVKAMCELDAHAALKAMSRQTAKQITSLKI